MRASDGEVGETFRLHVPGRVVAFGKQDVIAPGYCAALDAARQAGYSAVERLAGGRAALFHEGTLAFSWVVPDTDPRPGITARFEMISQLIVRAMARLGVVGQVGEVSGEYCPGRYSVNVDGAFKVMGVGQRLARKAAHIGGVVVVRDAAEVRRVLAPVYRELGLAFTPGTAAALEDFRQELSMEEAADAILQELTLLGELEATDIDPGTLRLAETLVNDHVSPMAQPDGPVRRLSKTGQSDGSAIRPGL